MRRFLMDTNVYSNAMRGDFKVVQALQEAGEIGICAISVGELLAGFRRGIRPEKNREELHQFLDSPRVKLYGIDPDTADFYAAVLNGLRQQGTPIPTNDVWIAACAMQHGLPVFTFDAHFRQVPGLLLL